jgi:hypothetical protein
VAKAAPDVTEHQRVIAGEHERQPSPVLLPGAQDAHGAGSRSITRGLPVLTGPFSTFAPLALTLISPADRRAVMVAASRSMSRQRSASSSPRRIPV